MQGRVVPVDRPTPAISVVLIHQAWSPRDSTSAESGVVVSQPGTQAGEEKEENKLKLWQHPWQLLGYFFLLPQRIFFNPLSSCNSY